MLRVSKYNARKGKVIVGTALSMVTVTDTFSPIPRFEIHKKCLENAAPFQYNEKAITNFKRVFLIVAIQTAVMK
jgi:hypothetical protein